MKTDSNIISEMERLLGEYSKAVEDALENGLVSEKTAKTYLYHPGNFIRWCKGDFKPGEKNRNKQ